MKRDDVWWVRFGPSVGGEIQKARPAVIVSNDSANRFLNRLQVVPLTTAAGRTYPSEAIVEVRGTPHKAMADQLTTVSQHRLGNQVDRLTEEDMLNVERAIKTQLGFAG